MATIQTASEDKYLVSAMAQKDSVETMSVTLPCQYNESLAFPGPTTFRKQAFLQAAIEQLKLSPFAVWSSLSIKRSHVRSYDGVNVKQ